MSPKNEILKKRSKRKLEMWLIVLIHLNEWGSGALTNCCLGEQREGRHMSHKARHMLPLYMAALWISPTDL